MSAVIRLLSLVVLSVFAVGEARAEVLTKPVTWSADGVSYAGSLVYDAAKAKKGKLPGVLVVHQYMGPGDYEQMRAGMLAREARGQRPFQRCGLGREGRPTELGGDEDLPRRGRQVV